MVSGSLTPLRMEGYFATKITLLILHYHVLLQDQTISHLCLFYQSVGDNLCMSLVVRLLFTDLMQFPMMVVLQVSFNVNVVVREGKHSIYLLCHIGQKFLINTYIYFFIFRLELKFNIILCYFRCSIMVRHLYDLYI